MAINSFTGINSFLSPLGLTSAVDKANSYQAPPPVVAPKAQPYQPLSLKDLYSQSHPTPPDARTETEKLFASFGEGENPELLRRAGAQSDYDFITSTDPTRFNDTWKDKFHTAHLFDAFQSHDFGVPENPWQELVQNPGSDLANARAFGIYSPLAHQQDPYVKYLNTKYPGDGRLSGGWKIGDNLFYSPTKAKQGNLSDYYPNASGDMNGPGMFDLMQKDMPNAFNDDGTFNPAGWGVSKGKGGKAALSGLLNTIAIIAPAFGGMGAAFGEMAAPVEIGVDTAGNAANSMAASSSSGLFGQGGIYGMGLDTGSALANSAVEKFAKNYLMSGGDWKGSLKGGLASLAGAGVANTTGSNLMGSAASGALGSYLGGGDPLQGLLRGGVSGVITGGANALNGGPLLNTIAPKLGVSLNDVLFPKKKPRRA